MNLQTKALLIDKADRRRRKISDDKGAEYTLEGATYGSEDADVLSNFKRIGEKLDIDPITVCAIYTFKHIDSLTTFLRRYMSTMDAHYRREIADEGEGIISRLDDARNYLDILECLLYESGVHPDSTQDLMPEFNREEFGKAVRKVEYDPALDVPPGVEAKDVRPCSSTVIHGSHNFYRASTAGLSGTYHWCPGRTHNAT